MAEDGRKKAEHLKLKYTDPDRVRARSIDLGPGPARHLKDSSVTSSKPNTLSPTPFKSSAMSAAASSPAHSIGGNSVFDFDFGVAMAATPPSPRFLDSPYEELAITLDSKLKNSDMDLSDTEAAASEEGKKDRTDRLRFALIRRGHDAISEVALSAPTSATSSPMKGQRPHSPLVSLKGKRSLLIKLKKKGDLKRSKSEILTLKSETSKGSGCSGDLAKGMFHRKVKLLSRVLKFEGGIAEKESSKTATRKMSPPPSPNKLPPQFHTMTSSELNSVAISMDAAVDDVSDETPSRSTPCKEAWVEEGKADNAKLLWSRREERSDSDSAHSKSVQTSDCGSSRSESFHKTNIKFTPIDGNFVRLPEMPSLDYRDDMEAGGGTQMKRIDSSTCLIVPKDYKIDTE